MPSCFTSSNNTSITRECDSSDSTSLSNPKDLPGTGISPRQVIGPITINKARKTVTKRLTFALGCSKDATSQIQENEPDAETNAKRPMTCTSCSEGTDGIVHKHHTSLRYLYHRMHPSLLMEYISLVMAIRDQPPGYALDIGGPPPHALDIGEHQFTSSAPIHKRERSQHGQAVPASMPTGCHISRRRATQPTSSSLPIGTNPTSPAAANASGLFHSHRTAKHNKTKPCPA